MKINVFIKLISIFIIFPILLTFIMWTESASTSLEVKYEYDEETNKVTAQIISDVELKDTKPTWKLSTDKKIYTKVFDTNMSYSTPVEDIYGNVIQVNINITQVRIAKLRMNYIYDETANQVTAQIISDIELKYTKPTWSLSQDKKIFTKIYTKNEQYMTTVVDKYNNTINIEININQIDMTQPKITVEYQYNSDETVTVYLKSNKILKDTKPTWTLSDDKKTYVKIYKDDR